MATNTKEKARCIAVFGTGSDVGKSIIATALCRYFMKKGLKTVPYKAQNMSNNSGITPEGLEMGRAQIVQAEAAGVVPHVDMNPVLLKPTSDVGAQIVLSGKVYENSSAADYHQKKEILFNAVTTALDRLRDENDIVIIEGAGSCAEVNLMPHDIVNFRIADYADAAVILVADIHRGGVFGQIVGTLECLPQKYRDLISGFIVNRFKGDLSLFNDGVDWIEARTGKKVFGTLPWFEHISIEAEDSVVIEKPSNTIPSETKNSLIGVIRLPHISNFTDFDPISAIEGIELVFLETVCDLSVFKAVILPGSKNTRHDLNWLEETRWAGEIKKYADAKGFVTGICGGYQMLGHALHDRNGCEGRPGSSEGLGLLPVETEMESDKTTTLSRFLWDEIEGTGYEIHMGQTHRFGGSPLLAVKNRNQKDCSLEDGCIAEDLNVIGTYMHGLFDKKGILLKWLHLAGLSELSVPEVQGLEAREREYDRLLDHFNHYIDTDGLNRLI